MKSLFTIGTLLLLLTRALAGDRPAVLHEDVSTFSIVARDGATGQMGIAVASRYFSVGSVVHSQSPSRMQGGKTRKPWRRASCINVDGR